MIKVEQAQKVSLAEVVEHIPHAAKITINYRGGESFHAKDVKDVIIGYDKGGKLILVYSEEFKIEQDTQYGVLVMDGAASYIVTTGDISSIMLDGGLGEEDQGVRRQLTFKVA